VLGTVASIKSGRTFEEAPCSEHSVVSQAARHSCLTNSEASGALDFTDKAVSAFTLGSQESRWLRRRLEVKGIIACRRLTQVERSVFHV
jgi:hypothetical protein